jgi:hypothetical protein
LLGVRLATHEQKRSTFAHPPLSSGISLALSYWLKYGTISVLANPRLPKANSLANSLTKLRDRGSFRQ